ncbi:MAG: polysaccharide biosynthesis protein [Bacteroidetes bacterium]|nr:MAG: polysaccharide biosynthesis protein [Bacteroidota bacterium]
MKVIFNIKFRLLCCFKIINILSSLRKLAGQTAVYGLSSILGRLLGYLLVPLYTRVLVESAYGSVVEMYSYMALLLIVLTYGMETAFFRFSESTGKREKVFGTGLLSILTSSVVFLIFILLFSGNLADIIRYSTQPQYIIYLAFILFFDSINTIPFANLRAENKPKKFVAIKLTGIFVNIGLNLIFVILIPYIIENWQGGFSEFLQSFYRENDKVSYIFISNVISSGLMTLMFLPQLLKIKLHFDYAIWRKMIVYALPLLVFGLAGVVNEVLDRVLLKYLLPENIAMAQLGIYGACYKVSIIMTIFIQAYRYAAEPFFFAQEQEKNAKETYAHLMNYFVMTTSIIFLATMLYIDVVILFVGKPFREGVGIVPILLLANMFLGIYYNLSVWYKLTNKTKFGAYISLFGAIITIGLNFYWIPRIGYMGSAWATLICYGSMMVISYFLGKKYYSIPYDWISILVMIGLSLGFYQISLLFHIETLWIKLLVNTLMLLVFLGILGVYQWKYVKTIVHK